MYIASVGLWAECLATARTLDAQLLARPTVDRFGSGRPTGGSTATKSALPPRPSGTPPEEGNLPPVLNSGGCRAGSDN